MPSAPAFETAAASRGTAAIGAWTIGCSIPSISHTGVRTAFAPSVILPATRCPLHICRGLAKAASNLVSVPHLAPRAFAAAIARAAQSGDAACWSPV